MIENMADIYSKKKRSEIMRAVRNKDSKMEVEFRKTIWRAGFRYRKNATNYFGKPDLVLKKYRTVIFLDSCFWHGCRRHCQLPSTRRKWWKEKIEGNKARDKLVNRHYRKRNWNVIRIWQHDVKKKDFQFDTNLITKNASST
ncbi:MAG: very short patch repair endonuclease [Desulfobacteraceae bacterium]|nr:very short patch repair endonuclease [Desulfobacteraceae bacterium]